MIFPDKTLETLKANTNRPIIVKNKGYNPIIGYNEDGGMKVIGKDDSPPSGPIDWENAYAIVTYNSNISLEATTKGIPCFTDPHNACAPISETNFSKITVFDLVYGIRIGGYYDHFLRGPGNNNVLGRMLKTQGFVITLTGEIWKAATKLDKYESPDDVDPLEDKVMILAHTLKHAILSQVPTFTGVDENMFDGSYEILPDKKGAKIYLYDNEVGGHGGFATLMSGNGLRFDEMMNTVRRQTRCPIRNCKRGCGQCIFIRTCKLGNIKINRRMLLDSGILQPQQSE